MTLYLVADIQIILSNQNKSIFVSKKELSNLYLGKTNKLQGIKITPIDSKVGYRDFYKKIIKKSPKELRTYWMREIYKGHRTPPKILSKEEIIEAIKHKTPLITYSTSKQDGTIIITMYQY